MRRALAAAALCAAVRLASAGAEEGSAVAFEAAALAYGLAELSPRVSLSASLPIAGGFSVQAAPVVAWGGEGGSGFIEVALPVLARLTLEIGRLAPYAGAGIELGWGRSGRGADAWAAGPIAEIGERFAVFKGRFFVEPYLGGALMAAFRGGGPALTPSLYGGLRIGLGL
jgi:hypothetical protein